MCLNWDFHALRFRRIQQCRHRTPVLAEAGNASGVANVRRFHPVQISFPGGTADRREATGTDRVSGSVVVHAMGKMGMDEVAGEHLVGPQELI